MKRVSAQPGHLAKTARCAQGAPHAGQSIRVRAVPLVPLRPRRNGLHEAVVVHLDFLYQP